MVPFKAGPSFAWGQPEPVSGQSNPRPCERVRPSSDGTPAIAEGIASRCGNRSSGHTRRDAAAERKCSFPCAETEGCNV